MRSTGDNKDLRLNSNAVHAKAAKLNTQRSPKEIFRLVQFIAC